MARKFRKLEKVEEEEKVEIKKDVEIIPAPEPAVEPVVEEPKIVITIQEEDVKDLDEKFGVDAEEEIKEIVSEEENKMVDESAEISSIVLSPVPEFEEEKNVDIVIKPKPDVKHLSPAELRAYQRTGILRK